MTAAAESTLDRPMAPGPQGDVAAARSTTTVKTSGVRPYAILGVIVALGLGGYIAVRMVTHGKESTDDAQTNSDMVPIAARVGGVVVSVPVVDNQTVKKGDLLAQMDPSDYENKVKQADAELRAAQAQAAAAGAQMQIVAASSKGGLGVARAALSGSTASVAGADAQIAAAQAMVLKAQADAEKVDGELRRAQALRKDDAIPQAQVDSLTSQAAAHRAAVAQAKAQVAAAEEGKRTAQTRIAEASGRVEQSAPVDAQVAVAKANADLALARVAAAEATLAQAQLNLSYTKVIAPADGHISKLAVHAGQLVQPSQTITNVLPGVTFVVANFKETQVGAMHAGQSAEIVLDGYPNQKFHAKVESVASGTGAQFSMLPPDNASGNFVKVVQRVPVKLVWTDLPPDMHLAAGLSADVTVVTK
jgi:membrane fusion protein, multidrug efflux system